MNQTQVQTAAAPFIAFLAGLLASKHLFGLDAGSWSLLIGGAIGFGATVWGVIAARKTALSNTLGNMPGTTVITDKKTADALPANNSVISNSDFAVVKK